MQPLIAPPTTFGWVLPRPDLGGWQDLGSFSTHANVEMQKPQRLTKALNSCLPTQRMQLPPLEMNLVIFPEKTKFCFYNAAIRGNRALSSMQYFLHSHSINTAGRQSSTKRIPCSLR